MSRPEDGHREDLYATFPQPPANGTPADDRRRAITPTYTEGSASAAPPLVHTSDAPIDFSAPRDTHDVPLDVPEGMSTVHERPSSVPQISRPETQGPSNRSSPMPPSLKTGSTSTPPIARDMLHRNESESPPTPLEPFQPLSNVDPASQSPTTLGGHSSAANPSSTGHDNAASSTSVLLPTVNSAPGTSHSAYTGWRVPLSQLRPETAEEDDGDYPTRTFSGEYLSDSGKSSDAGDDVFAFHRPATGDHVNPHSVAVTGKKRKRTETSGTPARTPYDMAAHRRDCDYDPEHPPLFSGQFNLNNAPYLHFRRWQERERENEHTEMGSVPGSAPPATAISAISSAPPPSTADSGPAEVLVATRGHRARTRDVDSITSDDVMTEDDGSSTSPRRLSFGLTEMTGDNTVPDGHTTWGDGVGGTFKEVGNPNDRGEEDWEEDSPYAEVRASVSNIDDPDMPALTLRAVVLGLVLVCLVAAANTFLVFRTPAPTFPVLFVQVVAYPLGKFLAWSLPLRDVHFPRWLGGFSFSLNPCPFNIKEHTIIVMMANVGIIPAYGMYSIVTMDKFYHHSLGVGFSFVYILASQVTGLSMAGITRRFVVWPASMFWPGVLVSTTMLNTLHADTELGTGSMSRFRFFTVFGTAAFLYYFLPGYLFAALSYTSYACWIAPENLKVNQLMGIRTGLGMGTLTLDWSQIAWIGSPLTAPWWAQINIGIGFVLFYWVITPILYYKNVWYTKYLPMSAIQPADRFQNVYNVSNVLTEDLHLNETAYAEYSQVYLTAAFTMTYMLAFALTTAVIVWTLLTHGPRVWGILRKKQREPDDVHMKMMRHYPEVPDWWYAVLFLICFAIGIVSIEAFKTGLPVWGYVIAITMAGLYVVPVAIIYATANLEPSFNLIAELIPGYLFAGKPIPGMLFKTFALQTLAETMYFTRDMKLGHYMKVPPRSMFIAQISACAISCFVQIGVKEWMFATIPDLCAVDQSQLLTCANARTHFSGSVIWGLIGPARLFNKGGIYNPQLWMLLVGAVSPFPFWFYCRRYPESRLHFLNPAIIFTVCLMIPPASGFNIISFLVVGFIFMFWIRRYAFAWWAKYNYVLSAALDVGTLVSALVIFFALGLPKVELDWWGNNVFRRTMDWQGAAFDPLPQRGYFGPSTWKV